MTIVKHHLSRAWRILFVLCAAACLSSCVCTTTEVIMNTCHFTEDARKLNGVYRLGDCYYLRLEHQYACKQKEVTLFSDMAGGTYVHVSLSVDVPSVG